MHRTALRAAADTNRYLQEIGTDYAELRQSPDVYNAYCQLHELVLLRPGQTVAFRGFSAEGLRPVEAIFFEAPGPQAAASSH